MNYILFDNKKTWKQLLPLTYTRPISEIRVGITTITEKWKQKLDSDISFKTEDYLSEKYKTIITDNNVIINSSIIPSSSFVNLINNLKLNQAIVYNECIVAICLNKENAINYFNDNLNNHTTISFNEELTQINNTWDIFSLNDKILREDFDFITKNRQSQKLSSTVNVLGVENIFIEEGASLEFVTLNAQSGPIYIGKDAEVMESSVIRGPFALCEHSTLKMSAKVYGASTIGPHSKVGGELNNVVIFGFSNKAHDGFLGNAVIGEWCNLGADTNNSNLKNNYAEVKLWDYATERFAKTGLQFCGLIMGDHSKCGINTMFNTGTIVGVNANIFGSGFPRNFIPSYSWGGNGGFTTYAKSKAFEVATKVYERRSKDFNDVEQNILTHIFEITEKYRAK